MRFAAVLFDAAGTLIAPAEPVGETYARLAREQRRRALGGAPRGRVPRACSRERPRTCIRASRARGRPSSSAPGGGARVRETFLRRGRNGALPRLRGVLRRALRALRARRRVGPAPGVRDALAELPKRAAGSRSSRTSISAWIPSCVSSACATASSSRDSRRLRRREAGPRDLRRGARAARAARRRVRLRRRSRQARPRSGARRWARGRSTSPSLLARPICPARLVAMENAEQP